MNFYLHPTTKRRLDAIIKNPSHGYIFAGPAYMYKQAAAQWLADQLTNNQTGHGAANIYRLIPESSGTSKTTSIKIEAVKQLRQALSLSAFDANKLRVVLIERADMMSLDASNALLKTIEEPGARIVFVLTTDRLSQIPVTVRSRLSVVNFVKPNPDQLRQHFPKLDEAAYTRLWQEADGLPRLMDELVEDPDNEIVQRARQFLEADLITRFALAQAVAKAGQTSAFLSQLERFLSAKLQLNTEQSIAGFVLQALGYLQVNVAPRLVLEQLAMELEV